MVTELKSNEDGQISRRFFEGEGVSVSYPVS